MISLHLKKVCIQGFKSFADRTEIEFKEGITAIVGPNGSGKSNVSDAIRWVLGEQSVKVLRGNKMEDVIFSGTETRKALGYAEVTIVFDNRDGSIPIDYQEVAVTRRMFRSGESEYYINKNSCRLKDVRELFMDTGIGKDGYSIIGQGRIDEILSTKPEDRRNIFEEAAGIIKYKAKKAEAEKKLESTNSNLIRIKDIILELQKQHDSLKEQANKARIFLDLSKKVKEVEINLLIREIEALREEIDNIKGQKEKVEENLNLLLTQRKKLEDELNTLKENINHKNQIYEAVEKRREEILSTINDKKNQLILLEENIKFYNKDMERLNRELEDLNQKLIKLRSDNEYLLEVSATREEELSLNREDFLQRNNRVKKLNEKISLTEGKLQDGKNRLVDLYNLAAEKRSKLNGILSFKDNISNRIREIENEIDILLEKMEESYKYVGQLEKEEEEKNKLIIEENKYLTNLTLEEKSLQEKLEEIYEEIQQNKADLQSNIANFNMLKNMEDGYEGYYKGVKNLMLAYKKDNRLKDRLIGLVAELIRTDEKYEKAIEVALGGSLQNIVTKNEEDAKYIINYLREKKLGRVTLLPLTNVKGSPIYINKEDREKYNILGLGSELVFFDNKFKNIVEYLLGRTIVVNNLDAATKVARKFNYSYKVVTLEGDIVNPGGSMTGGSLPKINNNLLNRKHRLEKIKEEINSLFKKQEELEQEKATLQSMLEKHSVKIKELEKKLHNINIDVVKIENEKNKHLLEIDRSKETIEKLRREKEQLSLELNSINQDERKIEDEISSINQQIELLKEEIEKLTKKYEEDKELLQKELDEVTDFKIQLNLMENKILDSKERLTQIEAEIEETTSGIFKKRDEINSIKESVNIISNNIFQTKNQIDELEDKKAKLDAELTEIKAQRDNIMEAFYQIQGNLMEINENISILEKELNRWNIKETRCNMNLDNIYARLLEEYGLDYEKAKEFWHPIDNIDTVKKELSKLKDKIKQLGNVNLNSIEEYKAIRERLDFIKKQHDDLMMAKEDLEKVIKDMEEEMKVQFINSFNSINKEFNNVFSKLFNGGKASLELEDEKDVLNCGIEIKAQPPGRKLQTLNLLSGGEKSLTAVALLFAIMNIKPAPFCILDEIDAALDDANIDKYAEYLKNLAKDTQFIVITHRKGTMEAANVLYGVTMEEEGVSKVLSVKLTDALGEKAS